MKKKVSLKDIAKEVGVSVATVSYVLSKGKDSKIGEEVTKKVKDAAKKLNYQPNQIAKSLKSGKTFTLGLIVADISNPFFANIARIVEDEAAKLNYTVIFGSSDEKSTKTWDLIQFLLNRQVDGFIIVPTEGMESQIKYLKDTEVPFVLIDRNFPDLSTNYVGINNFEASYEAVSRLIQQGNRKIGILAYAMDLHHMHERIRGYRQALTDHAIDIKEEWINKIEYSDIKNKVKTVIDAMLEGEERVDAIFFATNTLAIVGLKYLNTSKYKVPDDIAVISFDEGEAFDFYYCPLTHIRQPILEIGRRSLKILTDLIEDNSSTVEQVILKADLVVKKSCSRGQRKSGK